MSNCYNGLPNLPVWAEAVGLTGVGISGIVVLIQELNQYSNKQKNRTIQQIQYNASDSKEKLKRKILFAINPWRTMITWRKDYIVSIIIALIVQLLLFPRINFLNTILITGISFIVVYMSENFSCLHAWEDIEIQGDKLISKL